MAACTGSEAEAAVASKPATEAEPRLAKRGGRERPVARKSIGAGSRCREAHARRRSCEGKLLLVHRSGKRERWLSVGELVEAAVAEALVESKGVVTAETKQPAQEPAETADTIRIARNMGISE